MCEFLNKIGFFQNDKYYGRDHILRASVDDSMDYNEYISKSIIFKKNQSFHNFFFKLKFQQIVQ